MVFQGALYSGRWGGWSDFLVRVDRPSDLGPFSYEVIDTKLKRRADPKHVLQLVLYSDLLAEVLAGVTAFVGAMLGFRPFSTSELRMLSSLLRRR